MPTFIIMQAHFHVGICAKKKKIVIGKLALVSSSSVQNKCPFLLNKVGHFNLLLYNFDLTPNFNTLRPYASDNHNEHDIILKRINESFK